jgi:hypothetical protein
MPTSPTTLLTDPPRPAPEAATGATAGHRRRPAPDDHLCGCGRLRESCVRDRVRALWG